MDWQAALFSCFARGRPAAVLAILLALLPLASAFAQESPVLKIDTERKYPTGFNPPRVVTENGKVVSYTPSTPIFGDSRRTGIRLWPQVNGVFRHEGGPPGERVPVGAFVVDPAGNKIPVKHRRTFKFAGARLRALGIKDGKLVVKERETGDLYDLPCHRPTDEDADPAKDAAKDAKVDAPTAKAGE